MIYQEALDWIHGQLKFGIKPGLERMAWMLEELGNPQDNLKAVHIVGTNGKGSTVNALQTIFSQAGYCLLYTSDAADDLLCVDLGGCLILKKKNT